MARDLNRPIREAWIVDAVRSPIGRYGGALATVRPDDLAAAVIRGLVDRSGIDADQIEDVILGCANQAGEDNRDVARMAVLLAGLPVEVGGLTVNRLCGSGLQAVNSAAHAIEVGDGDVFIAGGVESMTRAPYVMLKPEQAFDRGNREVFDTTLGWRFVNPRLGEQHHPYSMGETAENVAGRWEVGRDLQDAFALQSHQRAVAAHEAGHFADQIVPISVPQRKGDPVVVDRDEQPRADTSLEALERLKPAFKGGGTVTAGNASSINDGASAVLLVEASRARELGLQPMARVVSTAVAGVDPAVMGIGPIPASRKALERAGLTVDDLDLVELNEAFASQSIVCINELGLDPDKVNIDGGAIALGHPLGSSGGRLVTMLAHQLRRTGGRYGLATMCIGVGQGIATVIERIERVTRALVLGGGGITGIAWEAGVLAGLSERGWDVAHWDLVVGTSAGSVVGAKVLAEPEWNAWFARQLADATPDDDGPIVTMGGRVAAGFLRLGRVRRLGWVPRLWMAAFAAETFVRQRAGRRGRLRTPGEPPEPGPRPMTGPSAGLVRLGAFGLAARTASEKTYLEVIEQTLHPLTDWPDRLTVTAIDIATGEAVAIDARSGVPFFDAVAASCSVPGLMPVVTIGDRRYMDGGMASQTHADLALSHDEVLVIAPLDLGRLGGEVQKLREAGASVTVVSPSPAAASALGRNVGLLDPARRARAAREGMADGHRAADAAGMPATPPAGRVRLAGSEG